MKQKLPLLTEILLRNKRNFLIPILFFLVSKTTTAQTSGIYESYAIISLNGGANAYYDMQATSGNPDLQGSNLGSFTLGTNTLVVKGGQNKTFKNSGCNINGSTLYYRIYRSGISPGAFSVINEPWIADTGGGNQTWEGTGGTSNLISGIVPGDYTLEIYSSAGYDSCGSGTHYSANGSANYKASFTVLYNPSFPISITSTTGTGATGVTYATLKTAMDAINAGTHTGVVSVLVGGNTTETSPSGLNASGTGSASYTAITIQPTGGLARTISGALTAGSPLLNFNGADNVTINGLNTGGNSLTISNTTVSATAGTSTIRFINDATTNTIQNCTIKGSTINTASGIVLFSTTNLTTGGNDGNTITLNTITNAGGNRPLNAIYSAGTATYTNSGNTISNNTIYDVLNSTTASNGIQLAANNTTWTISGNSLYETTTFTPTASVAYTGISVSNATTATAITISGNFIGGSAASCSGTWTKAVSANTSNIFTGISINAGTGTASSVQNNTIKNISWTNFGPADWTGINIVAGNVNVGTTTGNTIGSSTGTGSIAVTNGGNANIYGININSTGSVNCQNNTIGAITAANSAGSTTIYGINKANVAGTTTISSNLIGSNATANSINSSGTSTQTQKVIGINYLGTATTAVTINGNIIANLNNATTEVNSSNVIGILFKNDTTNIVDNITNNSIHDLTIANASVGSLENASVQGILISDAGLLWRQKNITGNTIYNLSNTHASFAGTIYGILHKGASTTSTISKNFVHDLFVTGASSTAATIYGISSIQGLTTCYNNVVSLGGNTKTTLYGIYEINAGYAATFYYNSIYISGSLASGTTNMSYCYRGNASGNAILKNNIFYNARATTSGSSLHYGAYIENGGSPAGYIVSNDYYTSGTGGVLGYYASTNKTTLPIITGETGCLAIDPWFNNPGVSPASSAVATDYKISASPLVAVTGTGITTDYAGTSRSGSAPIMGAFEALLPFIGVSTTAIAEFHYNPGAGPSHELTYTVFGTNLTSNLTLTAPTDFEISTGTGGAFVAMPTITLTQSGGNVASTTIYVRLKAGLATAVYPTENIVLTSTGATTRNVGCSGRVGVYPVITTSVVTLNGFSGIGGAASASQSYTINGVNLTANISVIATSNYEVSLSSGAGFAASLSLTQSGGNVTTTTIYVRLKAGIAAGVYNEILTNSSAGAYDEYINCNGTASNPVQVWKNGAMQTSYSTLKATFDAINLGTHTGALTLKIAGNTSEPFYPILNASGGTSNYSSINIYPITTNLTIASNGTWWGPVLDFNGADNVTVDGRVNATGTTSSLTISNASSGSCAIQLKNDASNNIIKYCILKAETNASVGVITINSTGTVGNNNNLIDHNDISANSRAVSGFGIYSFGASGTNTNNTISNNNIHDYITTTSQQYAIYISSNSSAYTITGNSIYETAATAAGGYFGVYGIYINTTSGSGFTISDNYIGGSAPLAAGLWSKPTGLTDFWGIYLNVGTAVASSVQNNTIKNISWLNSKATWTGIEIAAGNVNIGTITGNTIGSATGTNSIVASFSNGGNSVYGINIAGSGTVNCQNNTIGSITAANVTAGSGAVTDFYGIRTIGTGTITISSNLIGSTTDANSINATGVNLGGGQVMYGIFNSGNSTLTMVANTVTNLTHGATDPSSVITYGISSTAGTNTITNNSVHHLTAVNSGTADTNTLCGLNLTSTAAAKTVTGNTIYNLTNNHASFVGDINGVYFKGNTGANIVSKNFIHDLFVTGATSTSAKIYGINIISGATTYSNNVISLAGNTKTTLYGIYDTGAASQTANLYFNTIYLDGTLASGSTNKSYCFYSLAAANTRNLRNNVFQNHRSTTAGTSMHYAISLTANTTLTSNYNNFFANGTGGILGSMAAADKTTIALWRTATGQDVNTVSRNPNFVNAGSALASDYKLQRAITGDGTTGITTDYEGLTRTYPIIGAFEDINLPPVELFLAGVSEAGFSTLKSAFDAINAGDYTGALVLKINKNTVETATALLTASGTGLSSYTSISIYPTLTGLSVSGAIAAPLIDFDGADNVTLDGAVNGTGTIKDLTVSNSSTSTLSTTSTLFIANASSNNTVKNCIITGSSTSTTSATVFFSYGGNTNNTITNCTVSANGSNLPTNAIYSAGTALNSENAIINNSIQDYFNPTLPSIGIFLAENNKSWILTDNKLFQTATRTTTADGVTHRGIFVASGGGHTINNNIIGYANSSGTGTTTYAGDFTTTFLGIALTSTATLTNIQGNTVSGINFTTKLGGSFAGIYVGSGAANIGTTTGNTIGSSTNANAIVINSSNSWTDASGIYANSAGTTVTIQNNDIGGFSTTGTAISYKLAGINTAGTSSFSINTNRINTLSSSGADSILRGIYIQGSGTAAVFSNTINSLSGTGTGNVRASGMTVDSGTTVTISKNKIYDLSETGVNSGAMVSGMSLAGGTSVTVTNNLIGDLKAPFTNLALKAVTGIDVSSTTASSSYNLYFNTIHLNASSSGANFGTAAISHTASTTATTANLILKNNIILNKSTAAGSGKTAAFYRTMPELNNLDSASNNNLYYGGTPSTSNLIFYDGTNSDQTLAAYQTRVASGSRETNSITGNVNFLSTLGTNANFLHVATADATGIESGGTPIATFTTDYDDTTRNTATPDIGADEGTFVKTISLATTDGCIGGSLVINGTNMTSIASATIGGTTATVTATSPTTATVTVGSGTTGVVIVTTTGGTTATSTQTFTVNPTTVAGTVSSSQIICTGTQPEDLTLTGNVGTVVKWQSASDASFTSPTDIVNTTTSLSGSTIGNLSATTYYRAVVQSGSCSVANSNYIAITMGGSTTWNGSTWSNGAPTSATTAIISGDYTATTNLSACSLTVNSNAVVVVNSGHNFNISGAVTVVAGASMTLENNANLIQVQNVPNSGNVIVKRNSSALMRLDYTVWASPVANQNLLAFSPSTLTNRFYTYNSIATATSPTGLYNVINPSANYFADAQGYLIRMPNTHPTTATVWNGQYTGVPNNGDYTFTMTNAGVNQGFNLIGNPYPSPIDTDAFVAGNSGITGTFYFWRKTNNSDILNPTATYCTMTTLGFTSNGQAQVFDPNFTIQTGQGFFVEAAGTATTVSFTNSMRVENNANQFFRSANTERNRIWLNATNNMGVFSQTLLGYMTNATSGFDTAIDGKFFNDGDISISSLIGDEAFAIQGRSLPFDPADVVPLSFKVTNAGTYSIAIDHTDGLFAGSQNIFLKDKLLNVTTNISATAYTFASEAGTFNSRFEIVYQNPLSTVPTPTFNENSVVVYKKNQEIVVNTGTVLMANVKLFDLRGRLLTEKKNINASETRLFSGNTNEVLLVQISSDAAGTVTKKIVN